VSLTLRDHVATLDQNQRRNFVTVLWAERTEDTASKALSYPRRSIWFIGLLLLTQLRTKFEGFQVGRGAPGIDRAKFLREIRELKDDMDRVTQWINTDIAKRKEGSA